MSFHRKLIERTRAERARLQETPVIGDCLAGRIGLRQYVAFLTEAYHHVKHTVPLLMACGSRLPERLAWLRAATAHYVTEEIGHHEWILADLATCGADADAVRTGEPGVATELMVAYAYDTIARSNPVGFFGMVQVLEGTSIELAEAAADAIARALGLPAAAFSYLRSHGALDREHVRFFAALIDRLADPGDQAAVVHAAKVFYRLYGDVLRGLPAIDDEEDRHAA